MADQAAMRLLSLFVERDQLGGATYRRGTEPSDSSQDREMRLRGNSVARLSRPVTSLPRLGMSLIVRCSPRRSLCYRCAGESDMPQFQANRTACVTTRLLASLGDVSCKDPLRLCCDAKVAQLGVYYHGGIGDVGEICTSYAQKSLWNLFGLSAG